MFPTESLPRAALGFEFLERLGAGAAGEVYLARSRAGKLVAIKTVHCASSGREHGADTFAREATVCARLHHPCIVQMRAFLDQPGLAALVFEYVPGVALARVLRLCEARGERLPDAAGWRVVERVLTALAYAHAFRGEEGRSTPIVHRDLSPSNVLLDWRGGVKIADFGIAKVLGVSPATRLGLVKGTLGCMAPEQARGEAVDERADVYAAALLAWRLATGRVPFARHQRDEFELLRAMRNPRIHPLGAIRPDLPARLVDAIATALEADPARRTIAAAELAAIVAAEVDVRAGESELGALLQRWRPDLESALKRGRGPAEGESRPRLEHTMQYEEAALAFDDEQLDGATVEAHALPAAPHEEPHDEPERRGDEAASVDDEVPSPALPAARIEPAPLLQPGPPARGAQGARGASMWDLILFAVLLLAGGVATFLALRL